MTWFVVRPNSRRLLYGVDSVGTRIGKRDHLRVRSLRLQQERTEVRIVQWMAHTANHRAAQCRNGLRGLGLKRDAKGVIHSHEIPALVTFRHQRFGKTGGI
jgi:hypothetical protein